MRLVAALLAWLTLVALTGAKCDALILIQPGVAGSQVPLQLRPAGWVLWPVAVYPQGHTELLSLVTGKDWLGDNVDCRFSTIPDGKLRAEDGPAMQQRGYFDARREFLGDLRLYALSGPERSFRETELLLCLDGPKSPVPVLDARDAWPTSGVIVHDASSWAEALGVAQRAERSLVIEYPPSVDRPWTRIWMFGSGWAPGSTFGSSFGVPVKRGPWMPGVLPARYLLDLLRAPQSFEWSRGPNGEIPAWLGVVRFDAPKWLTLFGLTLAVCLTGGLLLALRERHSMLLPELLLFVYLCPAACVLGGNLARQIGPSQLELASAFSLVALYWVSQGLQWARGRWMPHAHRLLAPALVSCVVFTFANPLWSVLSGELRSGRGFPPAAFGCWFASIVAVCAFVRGTSLIGEWLARLAVVGMCAAWFGGRVWWAAGAWPCVIAPLVAMLVGEGVWRRSWLPVLPILGALTTPGLLCGVAWEPGGLLSRAGDSNKLNGAEYVAFIVSPLFVGTCALVFLFSLISDRFLLHQYRRLIADDPRRLAVLSGGGALGLMGIAHPSLLTSALWCAVAGLGILVMEGVEVL